MRGEMNPAVGSARRLARSVLIASLVAGCVHMTDQDLSQPALDGSKLPAIDAEIESFIARRQLPGAALHLERGDSVKL